MKNSIAERITDFIIKYPPFSFLTFEDVLKIAIEIKVIYLEKNQTLFKINDTPHDYFYIVKDGAVGLLVTSDMEESLIDKCDEGDVLGLRPFFAKNNYLMIAKAREESILYAIPIEVFKPYIIQNQDVLQFLLESFASNTRNPYDKLNKGKLISENIVYTERQSIDIQYYQPIKYTHNPITASGQDIVKFVAKTMSLSKIGSVIIHENHLPIGIVTDKDLRSKIATGLFSIEVPVSKIMSSPVITVAENISVAETQLMMLKHNVGHLCVTVDGTPFSKITGIISENDVIVAQANNPGMLLKQAKRATQPNELKEIRERIDDLIENSLEKNIPVQHVSNIVSEINRAICYSAIKISIEKMGEQPPVDFAWFNMGSQGRNEQLLRTDQDNALVFADVSDEIYEWVKNYFIELSRNVNEILKYVGYEFCPAQMMASNPLWCKSLSEWKNQFTQWIQNPGDKGILMSTIFFDYEFVYGQKSLEIEIADTIYSNINNNQIFFAYLGADALKNPPPLGFFRQFLVENDGEHKDEFDIKARALLPLIDAARLLVLSSGIKNIQNTYLRFKKLSEIEPQNSEVFDACAEAFSLLSRFRTQEGLLNKSNGKYLKLNDLSKSDKVKLKNAFTPIQELQDVIKNRFQLTYFT
jgi:CBS domain-containing protein